MSFRLHTGTTGIHKRAHDHEHRLPFALPTRCGFSNMRFICQLCLAQPTPHAGCRKCEKSNGHALSLFLAGGPNFQHDEVFQRSASCLRVDGDGSSRYVLDPLAQDVHWNAGRQ
jgi:hypothetical protein